MKLIAINSEIKSSQKTQFLRALEFILIKNKMMSNSQLKKFRASVACEITQELEGLSRKLQQNALTIF